MEDLYDGPKGLFCAGMALGSDKVAVFSFHRYHPQIRMSPLKWHDYAFQKRAGDYSYFDERTKRPLLLPCPPVQNCQTRRGLTIFVAAASYSFTSSRICLAWITAYITSVS